MKNDFGGYDEDFDKGAELNEKTASWLRKDAKAENVFFVKTKNGIFKLKEREWGVIAKARKRAEKTNVDASEVILAESIVGVNGDEKAYGEETLRGLPASTTIRLLASTNFIYEVDDFL